MHDAFLLQCRGNYFDKITPANLENRDSRGYKEIVSLSIKYFDKKKYNEFSGFLMEGQYLIDLWAAHMLLEYGMPNENITSTAVNIITKYSNNTLLPNVAEEERIWLDSNIDKHK